MSEFNHEEPKREVTLEMVGEMMAVMLHNQSVLDQKLTGLLMAFGSDNGGGWF